MKSWFIGHWQDGHSAYLCYIRRVVESVRTEFRVVSKWGIIGLFTNVYGENYYDFQGDVQDKVYAFDSFEKAMEGLRRLKRQVTANDYEDITAPGYNGGLRFNSLARYMVDYYEEKEEDFVEPVAPGIPQKVFKVRCVNNTGMEDWFELDKVYSAESLPIADLLLVHCPGGETKKCLAMRFEVIE